MCCVGFSFVWHAMMRLQFQMAKRVM
jgi:hypothetical protein